MQADELRFLLKLLGHEGYHAPIRSLKRTTKSSVAETAKTCRSLAEREIISYTYEISKFEIEVAGKALLQQDATQVPLSEQQLVVLTACKSKSIVPSDISSRKLPVAERQPVIQDLEKKGLLKAKKEIKEVWLTEKGFEYLRDELNPTGIVQRFDLSLLGNYLNFLRKSLKSAVAKEDSSSIAAAPQDKPTSAVQEKPTDEEILQMIRSLDQELGTENYLPIFHLRRKLQPPLSRDELDQALYRLQRQDELDISSLVEAIHYTPEEIQAGILQDAGGPLFFLIVNE